MQVLVGGGRISCTGEFGLSLPWSFLATPPMVACKEASLKARAPSVRLLVPFTLVGLLSSRHCCAR